MKRMIRWSNTFATNTLQWAASIRAEGVVRDPFPEAQVAAVHEADIAAVAVRALLDPGHQGAVHVLTGSRSVTQREQAELIGAAIGRRVEFAELDVEDYRRTLARWGPLEVADALVRHMVEAVDRPALVTNAVQEVTGRPARSFAEWATDHAADFA
ncbi:hypothetical protein ABZ297_16375 [Nonomuraea sp. NPDC005983]|uniref:hypothetical protein n=1 Tax=Nonomuraea sp. NPDC005983 TaxID=3155595 RepID=UPI0033BF2B54